MDAAPHPLIPREWGSPTSTVAVVTPVIMTLTETLLACAAVLASLSGAIVAFVLWSKRPRYRRARRFTWIEAPNPSASLAIPRRPDEGSPLSVRPPRLWTGSDGVPVADVEDDTRASGAEVPLQRA